MCLPLRNANRVWREISAFRDYDPSSAFHYLAEYSVARIEPLRRTNHRRRFVLPAGIRYFQDYLRIVVDDAFHRGCRVDFASNSSLPIPAADLFESRKKPRNPRSHFRGNDRCDSPKPRESGQYNGESAVPQCDVRDCPADFRGLSSAVDSRGSRGLRIRGDGVSAGGRRGGLGASSSAGLGTSAVRRDVTEELAAGAANEYDASSVSKWGKREELT